MHVSRPESPRKEISLGVGRGGELGIDQADGRDRKEYHRGRNCDREQQVKRFTRDRIDCLKNRTEGGKEKARSTLAYQQDQQHLGGNPRQTEKRPSWKSLLKYHTPVAEQQDTTIGSEKTEHRLGVCDSREANEPKKGSETAPTV